MAASEKKRRQKKKARTYSEEQYRFLFESNPYPMWVCDLGTLSFLAVNDAAVHHYGYSRDEFLGMTIEDIRAPVDIPALPENVSGVRDGLDAAGVWRHRKKDGNIIFVEITSHTLIFEGRRAEVVLANDITERRRIEEELRQSEERFHLAFENTPIGMALVGLNEEFLLVNKALCNILGYTPEKLLATTISAITHPDDREIEAGYMRNMLDGAIQNFQIEKRYIHADGHLVWGKLSASLVSDSQGNPFYYIGQVEDITGHKQADEKLKQSEEKYRDLFENANDAICILDSELKYKDVNKKTVEMLGYTREELLKMSVFDIIPTDQIPRSEIEFNKLRDKGSYEKFIGKVRTKDGRFIDVEVSSSAIMEDDIIIGSRDIIRDITERKQSEEALSKSKARLLSAQTSAHIGNWEWDLITDELYWSDENYRIFGLDPQKVIPSLEAFLDTVKPEEIEFVKRSIEDALSMKKPFDIDIHIIRPDGKERIVNSKAQLDFDKSDNLVKMVGTVQDITERQRAEEKLRLFRSLIDRSNDAIFVSDPETGLILDVNNKACSNLGYTREELLNMRVFDFEAVIPDNFSWKEHSKEVEEKGYMILEGLHRRKDGTTFPAEINVNLIVHGKNSYMVAVARDITERRRAEEELKIKAHLLDKALDSIFVFDLNGNFIYLNDAAYKSRGYSKDEMMKLNLHDIDVPEYARLIDQRIMEMLEKGEAVFESAHFHKNKSVIPVEVHASVIESGDKQLILGITRDITERKRAEKMLQDNARAELYGFIVSALPVFASNIPSSVRTTLVSNFAERFEKNMRPRFEVEMKRLGYGQEVTCNSGNLLDVLTIWLIGLFSNFGIRAKTISSGTKRAIEFSNCPWKAEASGNPIYCFICRTIVIRSFMWTSLKGSAEQSSSIANGGKTCRFEIHVKP